MSKSLKLLAVMIGAFAFTVFVFRHQPFDVGVWSMVAAMMVIIFIPFAVPPVGTFIADRPRKMFWAGIALTAAGLVGFLVLAVTSAAYGIPRGITGSDPISTATMYVVIAGISLTILPRSLMAQKRLDAATSKPREVQPKPRATSTIGGGWNANVSTVRQFGPFLRIAGPWIVLLWAAPFVGIHLVAYLRGLTPSLFASSSISVDAESVVLGEQLPFLLTILAYPTVLVAWHRFILERGLPRIMAMPDRAAMRYLFRLWMIVLFLGIIVTLTVSNAPDLAHLLGMHNDLPAAVAISTVAMGAFVYGGSQFALVLPAIATGDRNFLGAESAYVTRRLGWRYPLGFVISLLPFGLLALASALGIYRSGISELTLSTSLAPYALRLVPQALIFLALLSCATYLSWTYSERSKEYAELAVTRQAAQ